ncbi:VanZ family protein [Cellulomonas dongxiuzhuiae]|uniref:VanZ family protein n=1 Tax=Cellulomonas dongxiuzhuiae TaxID=2819979 RepID=A0ABX8GLF8_9CELL|nr:VanZ family protein [Cellulomonas dongxiuzhuiae]QWC16780.1 VanZ family protein [Cellulomonas dongxiuzhuiae]
MHRPEVPATDDRDAHVDSPAAGPLSGKRTGGPPPGRVTPVTGRARRWLRVALVVYLAAVGVVTLRPAPPDDATLGLARQVIAWLEATGLPVSFPGIEAAANVVMFVPFGVLVGLLLRRPSWVVVLLGAATSGLIETVQRWLPTRFPTLQDVVMNTLGAAVGVLVLTLAVRLRAGRAAAEAEGATRLRRSRPAG